MVHNADARAAGICTPMSPSCAVSPRLHRCQRPLSSIRRQACPKCSSFVGTEVVSLLSTQLQSTRLNTGAEHGPVRHKAVGTVEDTPLPARNSIIRGRTPAKLFFLRSTIIPGVAAGPCSASQRWSSQQHRLCLPTVRMFVVSGRESADCARTSATPNRCRSDRGTRCLPASERRAQSRCAQRSPRS